ncbi:MAG: AAA family ATPase [Bdellovibrionales bacterium]|nr:AAA family ATPase [Bdellovibrionales bacterium]
MATIRCIEIRNFRSIRHLKWFPSAGFNCLIGPGDSGKSSILDAIDFCLGARRNIQFDDGDFFELDVARPILITITVGDLADSFKTVDGFGIFLRGYDDIFSDINDEPDIDLETVLSIRLRVESDLEPTWTLYSDRAETQAKTRNLSWSERSLLAPTRIAMMTAYDLSWRKGSVLNRLSEDRAEADAAMAKVNREARAAFGEQANDQLKNTREIVKAVAASVGIDVGNDVKALLDLESLSVGGAAISLHNSAGVPLRNLGTGSTRLLLASLQRRAAASSSIILLDELEYGLEPHRIVRLIGSLGAKDSEPSMQVFVTTHSPVALRELSGDQVFVVRQSESGHEIDKVGTGDDAQGAIRLYPEAFLASSVLVCEGATEVGFIRGIDQYFTSQGSISFSARGSSLVDGKGSEALKRASSFRALGFRTALLRDDDVAVDAAAEKKFIAEGGSIFKWRAGNNLEDELFSSLDSSAVKALVQFVIDESGLSLVDSQIGAASRGSLTAAAIFNDLNPSARETLATASSFKNGWFKSVGFAEQIAVGIVAPGLASSDAEFQKRIREIFAWLQGPNERA